jgi:UTP:GlnB (protein PII) uridylyltransferase
MQNSKFQKKMSFALAPQLPQVLNKIIGDYYGRIKSINSAMFQNKEACDDFLSLLSTGGYLELAIKSQHQYLAVMLAQHFSLQCWFAFIMIMN